jgi:tetratricopeptide (TPR) repeat protein
MTAKFLKIPAAVLACALALTLGAGLSSAGLPPSPGAPAKDKDKGKKVNKAELNAYNAIVAAQNGDPAVQIKLAEDFVTKYPDSEYVKGVYGLLTNAYYATGNIPKMMDMSAKTLAADPDNADVLALTAMVISRRAHASTPDGAAQLEKAEGYARHALEVIPNMQKPNATMDDATFQKAKNDKLAIAHSALGLIDYDHKKYEDARTELTQAVQLASAPDPVDYYMLGNADEAASYYHDAAAAFQKCADTGPLTAQCKANMATAQHDAETKMGR